MHDKAREITEPPSREADELLQADAAASMTVVAPPGEHALLTRLREARGASTTKQIGAGIMLPIRALGLLRAHRELVPLVIIPVLINIVLFAISAYFLVGYADSALAWLWAKPVGEDFFVQLTLVLWYVLYIVAILIGFALSYVVVLMLGGIVASPFHDTLSEATERILLGVEEIQGTGYSFAVGTLRSIVSNIVIAAVYLVLMIPVLLLNLIPFAGTVASSALGMVLSAYFVGLEYCDPVLERRGAPMRRKFGLLRQHFWLAGSFGLGTTFLLWVPLLNFLCMPIAVIGGTAMGIVLLEDEASEV